MARYEYELINLKAVPCPQRERVYKWKCRRASGDADHDGLEAMLNDLGRDGWEVVGMDSDARFGSTVLLKRLASDAPAADPAAKVAAKKEVVAYTKAPAKGSAAPVATIDAAALAEAFAPVVADLKTYGEQITRSAPPSAPPVAILDEASIARLEQSIARLPVPVVPPAVIDTSALRAIEATLTEALDRLNAAPTTAVLDESAVRWLEGTLERVTARGDDEPPAGPGVAVLDEASVACVAASLQTAVLRAAAALPTPTIQTSAIVDAAALKPLQAAIEEAALTIASLRPDATLDAASVARLEDALREGLAQAAPLTAVIDPAVITSLQEALAALPTPQVQVQATTELSAAATAELRSALSAAIAALPQPTAEVSVTTTLADEAILRLEAVLQSAIAALQPVPVTVTLEAAALARLERIVASLETAVNRTIEVALTPQVSAVEPTPEEVTELKPSWWPRVSQRLRLAFARA